MKEKDLRMKEKDFIYNYFNSYFVILIKEFDESVASISIDIFCSNGYIRDYYYKYFKFSSSFTHNAFRMLDYDGSFDDYLYEADRTYKIYKTYKTYKTYKCSKDDLFVSRTRVGIKSLINSSKDDIFWVKHREFYNYLEELASK